MTGQSLQDFLTERILTPLDMTDTGFSVGPADTDRLAALYAAAPGGSVVRYDALGDTVLSAPSAFSGGGGLVSSGRDYHRFTQMLLQGGELDGFRLFGTRTLRYMTRNHLPGGADLETFGRPLFAEMPFSGVGFGLGFAVIDDPVSYRVLSTAGDFGWGGAASTASWVDPPRRSPCCS